MSFWNGVQYLLTSFQGPLEEFQVLLEECSINIVECILNTLPQQLEVLMDRKKLFFGLGVASGGAAIVGSGAFSSIQAERGVSVEVVGDESALLALEPADGPNGQYASVTDDGLLEVQVSEENDQIAGEGVNPNSWYDLGDVFKITNQGSQEVGVWIEHDSDYVEFKTGGKPLDESNTPAFAEPGDSLSVRIIVDTRDVDDEIETVLDEITIHANADAESEPAHPDVEAMRAIENETLSPGEETTVTLTIELNEVLDVDLFERFDPKLGTATLKSASVEGTSVAPSFVDLDDGGGIVLFDSIGTGELTVEYSLSIAEDAPTGTVSYQPNLLDVDELAVPIDGVDTVEVVA